MAKQNFQVGDTVQLKSGGPVMTIRKQIGGPDSAWVCNYFTKEERLVFEEIFGDQLNPIDMAKSGSWLA